MAFGEAFANEFPTAYTLKYWTTPPENLTTDWVGERVYFPNIDDVKEGYTAAPQNNKHYLTTVRYPKKGGYNSYANLLRKDANIKFDKEVSSIDLEAKTLQFTDGELVTYQKLINTMPLPDFIEKTKAPAEIKQAAKDLSCSELLLINIVVNHAAPIINQWFYVYDTDKYSTRVSYTDLFSPHNGREGQSGLQVEVYFSKYRKQTEPLASIVDAVCKELVEMGVIKNLNAVLEVNTKHVKYANVIFDLPRRQALDKILNYLQAFGLKRELQDLEPMTDWNKKLESPEQLGDLVLAGRFGEWKYHWTDDCVMRGLFISKNFAG